MDENMNICMRSEILRAMVLFWGGLALKKGALRSYGMSGPLSSTPKGNTWEDRKTFLCKFYVLPYKIYFCN
jgi:hypothetical protein